MSNARKLIAVPYLGEFGWELMNWQGRVRRLAEEGSYEQVVVCAPADRRVLYAAPPVSAGLVFVPTSPLCLPGISNEDHRLENGRAVASESLRQVAELSARRACDTAGVKTTDADFLWPDYQSGVWPTTPCFQAFAELRLPGPITTDIVLVPRLRDLAPERNQPAEWWAELGARLSRRGLNVTMYSPTLDGAVRQLSHSRLAVGASTGGLHLASLCRCPHYVWGSGPDARWTRWGMTNRQRYETIWNPFGTPCRYDECGWRPTLGQVEARILHALDDIGLTKSDGLPSWSFKPQWRWKRGLAQVAWPASPLASLLPWRVRRLMQEYLV